ncbi:putative protein (sam-dependent methyltransferases) protein [Eutypa lata UCREL1]|uniref:Methyltransferase domain-containing protein n=1 Tax=Eutypa lata (strain UCR-EL1) TaxID=1287681 RepID=M7SIU8_EUTLA|nr:putative protein (sam-dependent methyltransferases) protein [Eutypa lata UCREL1]
MESFDQVQKDYDDQAGTYAAYTTKPYGILETQLMRSALGDCAGARVLDLGGGTGIRARQALDLGAASVDVVDLSPGMVQVGEKKEEEEEEEEAVEGRDDTIRWFTADVSKSLEHLKLRDAYDLVMANWVFDHARSVDELEGMWRNVAARLRPGGRFVGIRACDPRRPAFGNGEARYGVTYKDFVEIPGGLRFRYILHSDPPIEFEAASMEVSYSGSTEMHERFGLCDVQVEPYGSAEIVGEDPEYWALFLEAPPMAVVKARKKTAG